MGPGPADSDLSAIGEEGIIRFLRGRHPPPRGRAVLGIGDDTALFPVRGGQKLLLTTDIMAEGVHFDLQCSSPEDVGFKLAAVNVSDVGAMGGKPTWALLSLSLPRAAGFDFVRGLSSGLRAAERKFGFHLLGGDTTASRSGIFASLALLGDLEGARPLCRSGAAPGDLVYVTGHLGASVLGLEALRRHGRSPEESALRGVIRRHLRPSPPLSWAVGLAKGGFASAAIDLSDGFSTDLARLCRESGVGAEIETARLPVRPGTLKAAALLGRNAAASALHGGEEYELLFTVRPGKSRAVERRAARRGGTRICRVGRIVPGREIRSLLPAGGWEPLKPLGWRHFGE